MKELVREILEEFQTESRAENFAKLGGHGGTCL